MNFEATEDRRLLSDTLTRYLRDNYPIEHRTKVAYNAPYHDPAKLAELIELGVLHALAPEAQGGFGGTGFDITTVFEPLGAALCPEPILPALLSAGLLAAAGTDLAPLLEGRDSYAVAIGEPEAPYALEDLTTTATGTGTDACTLSGRKSVVYGGSCAQQLLVAARHDSGVGLYEVSAEAATITGYGMIDGGPAAEVILDDTPATCLIDRAEAPLQDALDRGALALCAEALGVMSVIQSTTLDYLQTRKQFGVAIGKFQALQHRMVELMIEIEQARSITILAASAIGGEDQSLRVSMAKNLIGRTAKLVAEEAIQMHGGIAMTWEYPISHYAKRLTMIDAQLGDTDTHLERVMAANMA